jgi:hypothetical protein
MTGYNSGRNHTGGVSMKGSVWYSEKEARYYVTWYDKDSRRTVKIGTYLGDKNLAFKGEGGRQLAERMLAQMRGDEERGVFRLNKYRRGTGDVPVALQKWLDDIEQITDKGAFRGYRHITRTWLIPFFQKENLQVHEITKSILLRLLQFCQPLQPSSKVNVFSTLHKFMVSQFEDGRISTLPVWIKRKDFGIEEKPIDWIDEDTQEKVLAAIPKEHQPIFRFLAYHLRRIHEAIHVKKADYREGAITIRKSKDKKIHIVPLVSKFAPYLVAEMDKQKEAGIISPYLFVQLSSYDKNKRYSATTLHRIWYRACEQVGVDIDLYRGTKTSRASILVNKYGLNLYDLQIAGQWSQMSSVKRYGAIETQTVKRLLEGNVVQLQNGSELIQNFSKRKDNGETP